MEYLNSIFKFDDPFWADIIEKDREVKIAKELCDRNIYHHSSRSESGPASKRVTTFSCWNCDRSLKLTMETANG